ncbi:MAG: prephenate dehydratase [Methanosarcinaceae archaeon]|nr:prephenate dehydratase [Methanosarcinaceae archaeon]MDD4748922.1 prephenate dehydratase [Methanosarcinaceae archaeon]
MKIGVLGPEGSYSEKAAKIWIRKKAFEGVTLRYFGDIEAAFKAAADRKTDFSVVPIENSIEGSVGVSLALLRKLDIVICGEIVVRIEHCLLSKGNLKNLKGILSHPQALAQCRHFLKKNFPGVEIRNTESTSHAARLAGEIKEIAAIASPEAAKKYGLQVLLANIQDEKENQTRFLVIRAKKQLEFCKKPPVLEKRSLKKTSFKSAEPQINSSFKTSILVYLAKDSPGALYELLEAFAKRRINLTKIESSPSRQKLGDYYFYIDFEGQIGDALIKDALEDIKEKADILKVLGSYPTFKFCE